MEVVTPHFTQMSMLKKMVANLKSTSASYVTSSTASAFFTTDITSFGMFYVMFLCPRMHADIVAICMHVFHGFC